MGVLDDPLLMGAAGRILCRTQTYNYAEQLTTPGTHALPLGRQGCLPKM